MNTKHLSLILTSFLACAATGLRAQTMVSPPPPPPAMPSAPAFQADLSLPYVIQWRSLGVVLDGGENWMGNFLGLEAAYYNGTPKSYAYYSPLTGVYGGQENYRTTAYALNVVYRYTFSFDATSPFKFYIGGSAGEGMIDYIPGLTTDRGVLVTSTTPVVVNSVYQQHYTKSGRFDYTLFAGAQFDMSSISGLKAGYRFIEFNDAAIQNTKKPLDSGSFEISLFLRF